MKIFGVRNDEVRKKSDLDVCDYKHQGRFFILYFDFETKLFILNLVTTKHLLHQKACANRHEG